MMVSRDIVDAALMSRNMMAVNPVCPCCGDTLDRDDFPAPNDYPATMPAAVAKYGSMVCYGCIEDIAVCAGCGSALADGEGISGTGNFDGERLCNEGCEYDAGEAISGDDHSTYSVNDARF